MNDSIDLAVFKTKFAKFKSNRVQDLYSKVLKRSRGLLLYTHDRQCAISATSQISASGGAIVQYGDITSQNETSRMQALRDFARGISSQLLLDLPMVAIMILPENMVHISELINQFASAFRLASGQLYMDTDKKILLNGFDLKKILDLFPLQMFPVCGSVMQTSLMSIPRPQDTESHISIIEYSNFIRDVSTSFLARMRKLKGLPSDLLYVIGYNPVYLNIALRHGLRVRFIESDTSLSMEKESMIYPEIDLKMKVKKQTNFVHHNSQLKLDIIDSTVLSIAKCAIYIGAFPAEHLDGYDLSEWRILFIDPAYTRERIKAMQRHWPLCSFLPQIFDFEDPSCMNVVRNWVLDDAFTIIDDTWVDSASYSNFQILKLQTFSRIIEMFPRCILISLKWHSKIDINMKYVKAILPQPRGGNLKEVRVILEKTGREVKYKYLDHLAYMEKFASLSLEQKLGFIRHYHKFITINEDGLKYNYPVQSLISGLFSLSNTMNVPGKLLPFLNKIVKARSLIVVNFPNLQRIQYALKNDVHSLVAIKTNKTGELIFKSPSGKTWRDYGYVPSDLADNNMVQMTVEMMRGFLGASYGGLGYTTNTFYNDLFDIYVPESLMFDFFAKQPIGMSPIGNVKCFTAILRSLYDIPHTIYYRERANLLLEKLGQLGHEPNNFSNVGSAKTTIVSLNDVVIPTEYGKIVLRKNMEYNLSGHLLSLAIAAHFIPISVDMWIQQLIVHNAGLTLGPKDIRILYFDNKFEGNGMRFAKWHSIEEIQLTLLILEDYVALLLSQNYSKELVTSIYNVTVKRLLSHNSS